MGQCYQVTLQICIQAPEAPDEPGGNKPRGELEHTNRCRGAAAASAPAWLPLAAAASSSARAGLLLLACCCSPAASSLPPPPCARSDVSTHGCCSCRLPAVAVASDDRASLRPLQGGQWAGLAALPEGAICEQAAPPYCPACSALHGS